MGDAKGRSCAVSATGGQPGTSNRRFLKANPKKRENNPMHSSQVPVIPQQFLGLNEATFDLSGKTGASCHIQEDARGVAGLSPAPVDKRT
jgi:hypothetical protein